uniref:Uncharacterized protein n=1 Tax=Caenorhabditis japonica TaxID=281687 RepID=A0A8R1DXG7_CAEJA
MTRKQDSIRGVEQEQENDEEQQDLKEDSADRSPLNEIKENAQSRAQEESLRTIYRNNLKKILDRQFEPNGYPENLMSHVAREFLKVESYKPKEEGTTAEYLPDTDTKCVFCFKAVDSSGDAELMPCQGQMGSIEKRKIACRSKFHANCAIKYNAGSFLFQYSALPECQGKLQCPLHCCSLCNNEHYKQVAYAGEMTECALCLRAFHKELCIPAGSKNLDVEIKIEGRGVQFEMIVCPAHFTKKKTGKHIAACDECQNTKDLIKCSTCVRSFHKECQDVKTLDGQPIPADKCEKCLAGDAVRYDVPVLVRWSDNIVDDEVY